jgi:8-hydroxy-5-deazaflavin:NADPH oxidoreductase
MRIGVLGTGVVGQTLSGKLASLGHETMIGTRNVEAALARTTAEMPGEQPFGPWHHEYPDILVGTFGEAAAHGEVVINGTRGAVSMVVLELAGAENLDGKILIDVANPLDFSQGMPPSLTVSNSDSLGEQIQRTYPGARVVKTLNMVGAPVQVAPAQVGDGDHTLFVAGNDGDAKDAVANYLREWFGWREIVDLGDITNARAMEMYLALWIRLLMAGGPMFNIKVVR